MDAAVAVASHSFSSNPTLCRELTERYPNARLNETGRPLYGEQLVRFLHGYQKAITGLEVLGEAEFCALPELQLISKYGVGLDMVDLDAARRHGVQVRWTPGVNRDAVAELALGLMIALLRDLVALTEEVKAGAWRHHRTGRQLSSAAVGILGCGHVGQRVARLCVAFGAKVLAHDIRAYDDFYRDWGVTPVSFDALVQESDIITIHLPLDPSTRGMIGSREIGRMKAGTLLINTARGGIVDEQALRLALETHQLGGAACDVFAQEPPADRALLSLPNFIGTPHVGGGTQEAVLAMGRGAIAGLDAGPGSIDLTATAG
jgi:D-3-phosphoglycerate dehydrogenase